MNTLNRMLSLCLCLCTLVFAGADIKTGEQLIKLDKSNADKRTMKNKENQSPLDKSN